MLTGFGSTPPSSTKFSLGTSDATKRAEKDRWAVQGPKLLSRISGLFNNQKYSDVTIKIYEVVFYAHQVVICTQSEYFEKAFRNGWQESIEVGTKTIEFKEGSGAAYWRVLEYLYTGAYSDHLSTDEFTDDPELLKDVRVYALADMFLIEDLKAISEAKFEKRIQNCQLDTPFIACVREVYINTHRDDSKMRSAVVDVAVDLAREWDQGPSRLYFSDIPELNDFKNLLREGGDFVVDCFTALSGLSL
ncbi:hypothetical protein K3495_g12069 [Podosphaera aphanis]|nr:hypothetical protein K3495_g12069 [Podosphaera aphanis]